MQERFAGDSFQMHVLGIPSWRQIDIYSQSAPRAIGGRIAFAPEPYGQSMPTGRLPIRIYLDCRGPFFELASNHAASPAAQAGDDNGSH